jgi:hypothetical protein
MGHGYGLSHSCADGSTADYMDQWDVMSTAGASMAPHPHFTEIDVRGNRVFLMGPGLNAANMASRKWLDESRVWTTSNRGFDTVVKLRPLHSTAVTCPDSWPHGLDNTLSNSECGRAGTRQSPGTQY